MSDGSGTALLLFFVGLLFLVLLPFGSMAAIILLIHRHQARKRAEEANRQAAFAHANGLQFRHSPGLPTLYGGPFGKGFTSKARNLMWGQRHYWMTMLFMYEYEPLADEPIPGQRNEPRTELISGVYLGGALPQMGVRPENPLGWNPNDISLEFLNFNDLFRVDTLNRDDSITVLEARMMEFMVNALEHRPGYEWWDGKCSWWMSNGWLYTHRRIDRDTPIDQLLPLADEDTHFLTTVARRLSPSVVRRYGVTFGTGIDPNTAIRQAFPNV